MHGGDPSGPQAWLSNVASRSGKPPPVLGAPGSWSSERGETGQGRGQRCQHVQLGQAGHPLVCVLVNKDTLYIDRSESSILDKKAEA